MLATIAGKSHTSQIQALVNRDGWGEPNSPERWNLVTGGGFFMSELPDQIVTPAYWEIKGKYQDAVRQSISWKVSEYGKQLSAVKDSLRKAAVAMPAAEFAKLFGE